MAKSKTKKEDKPEDQLNGVGLNVSVKDPEPKTESKPEPKPKSIVDDPGNVKLQVSTEDTPVGPHKPASAESIFSPEPTPVCLKKGCVVVKRSGKFLQVSCPTHREAEIIEKTINDLLE